MAETNNTCQICKRSFNKMAGLHLHISKNHKTTIAQYYHKFFPRHDKYTGELIHYKDNGFYLTADFNNRHNLRSWIKVSHPDEVRLYITEFWKKRIATKRMFYVPSQVEMKSLSMPGRKYMSQLFGDCDKFFEVLGLKKRFEQEEFILSSRDISKQRIIVDSREQKPLEFDAPTRTAALKFGDYRLSNDKVSGDCYIERKSIMDFHGTVGKDRARFEREIERSQAAGAYLVVVVEGDMEEVYEFANSPFFNKPLAESKQREFSPSSAQFIFKNMRDFMQKFLNLQFLFVPDRETAAKVIERLFASSGEFKKIDLQYAFDRGQLI